MSLTVGSLCSGYEGLGLGLGQVLDTTTAWVSEVDPSACAILAARLPGVPNLGDLTVLDWSTVEPVDVLTAGWPCQPFSTAGRRQGANDARHLWPFIADALRVLRPRLFVGENVAGHLSLGFDLVLADLARLGFDARWTVVRASDVGACHRRARLFIVAHANGWGREVVGQRDGGSTRGQRAPRGRHADRLREDAADATEAGRGPRTGRRPGAVQGVEVDGRPPGQPRRHDRSDERGAVQWGAYGPAIARHAAAVGRPAPHPVDERGRLNPVFVEWMMMLPAGWVTDIVTNRSKALKALGNGVVPPQAAYAIRRLLSPALEAAA